MVNFILVMVGGGLGAMLREFLMLMVPNLADGFPLAILVANLLATFLLGLVTGLHGRQVLSDNISMLVGTGIIGGMSTFSSLAYGAVVLIEDSSASAPVASVYVATSLLFGYLAAIGGMKTGLRLVCVTKNHAPSPEFTNSNALNDRPMWKVNIIARTNLWR